VASPRPSKWTGVIQDPGARPDVALFGEPGFEHPVEGQRRVGTVVEGVFGMLAFERAGAPNPCATLGASNLGPEKVELLSQFDVLLVGTDPDAAGDKAFQVIHDALCRWTEVRRIHLEYKPDEAPEDYLQRAWMATLADS
jgi:DNA primase